MHTPAQCVLAGLTAQASPQNTLPDYAETFELGWLASMVGSMLSAEGDDKKRARAALKSMMDEGRRLLVAADAAAAAAAAPAATCGSAATARPCAGVNIRDCAGCMVGDHMNEGRPLKCRRCGDTQTNAIDTHCNTCGTMFDELLGGAA